MLESDLTALKRKELQALAKEKAATSPIAEEKDKTKSEFMAAVDTAKVATPIKENSKNDDTSPAILRTPTIPEVEETDLIAEQGSIVRFVNEAGAIQEGVIKRVNKNSVRVKLSSGKEVTLQKSDVSVCEARITGLIMSPTVQLPVPSTAENIIDESPDFQSSSPVKKEKKTNKKKKMSVGKKRASGPSGDISISPIKTKTSTPPSKKTSPKKSSSPQTTLTTSRVLEVHPQKVELAQQQHPSPPPVTPLATTSATAPPASSSPEAVEEERLMIDEECLMTLPKNSKKTKKKSSSKRKGTPKKQDTATTTTTTTVAAPGAGAAPGAADATNPTPPDATCALSVSKRVKQPSIVPKTTSAMRARAGAISQKKQRLSDISSLVKASLQSVPPGVIGDIFRSASKPAEGRLKCTIDSSILEKINQSSRRFSSSWSSSKPKARKSISAFSEAAAAIAAAAATPAAIDKTAAPVVQDSITAHDAKSKKSASARPAGTAAPPTAVPTSQNAPGRGLGALARPSSSSATGARASSVTAPRPHANTSVDPSRRALSTTSSRVRSSSASAARPGMMPARRLLSTTSVTSSGTSTIAASTITTGASRIATVTNNTTAKSSATASVTAGSTSRASPSKKTAKPSNPAASFLQRSSSVTSRRAPSPAINITSASRTHTSSTPSVKHASRPSSVSAAATVSHSKADVESQNMDTNIPKPFKARPAPNFSKIHKNIFNVEKSVVTMVKENKQRAVGDKMTKAVADALGGLSNSSRIPLGQIR